MAKKNELEYSVKLFNDRGIRTLSGDIIAISDGVVTLRYKKSKSKNYAMRTIAQSEILSWSGGKDKPSTVTFRDRTVHAIYKGQLEVGKDGFLKVTMDDGSVVNVLASAVEAVAEDGVDAPSEAIAGKKKVKKEKTGEKKKTTDGDKKPKKKVESK